MAESELGERGASIWLCGGAVAAPLFLAPLPGAAQQDPDPLEPAEEQERLGQEVLEDALPTFEWPVSGRPAGSLPELRITTSAEIQNDYTFQSEDDDNELNDLFATIEPLIAFNITPELAIESGLVLEPIDEPAAGESRAFEDHGLFAETLGLIYATGVFLVYGGKYNPPFGVAWDSAPGIYGVDFAEEYELTERIGLGGSVTAGNEEGGSHTLSGNLFFLDTTFLSESAINNRGRTTKEDGGVSNTESLDSFSITLDGEDMPFAPGVSYTLGVERQAAGEGDPADELGFVAGLYGAFDLTPEVSIEPIVEYVHLSNAEGQEQTRQYVTAGAALLQGPWNLSLSYTGLFTDPEEQSSVNDTLFQISAGYGFDFGLGLDVGYLFTEEDEVDSHTLGLLFAYEFDFVVY